MPSLVFPMVTAASPVSTPARAWMPDPRLGMAFTSSSAARTARSASSSRATGAPQTAITASPMNFSTVPPYRPITSEARSKYRLRTSRTSSASFSSANGVKPTRSANRTLTRRRSATGLDPSGLDGDGLTPTGGSVADARAAGDAARTPACSGVAHSEQNLAVGGLTVPQVGQAEANPDPHSVQNFAPGRFSVPQTGQFMRRGAYRSRAADRDSSLGSEASWDGRQLVEALGRRRCREAAVS